MQIDSLLHRAAELAPDWCEFFDHPQCGPLYYLGKSGGSVYRDAELDDDDRALILYAVLTECERRGLEVDGTIVPGNCTVSVAGGPQQYHPEVATAALSAFVAYLESVEVGA